MDLLGVIDLQKPKCIKHIKQKQLCYAEKSPTDHMIHTVQPLTPFAKYSREPSM